MKLISSGKLRIKKQPLPKILAYFVLIMPFFLATIDAVGLPSFLKYSIDVVWVTLMILPFFGKRITITKKMMPILVFVAVFAIYTIVIYLFNYQSLIYYLWGFRNNFRFYFAFIIYCLYFDEDDLVSCLKFIDIMFWVNALVSLFQFFVLGLKQDFLGGLFGASTGCNGYTLVFFSIVVAKSIIQFMNKEEKLVICLLKCGTALILSAMAELKFFFVIFVVIMLLATIFTSFSWRKIILVVFAGVFIMFAGNIITNLFGKSDAITIENLLSVMTSTSYSSAEDLSRFTAIPTISKSIMADTPDRLFGFGLGNCDTSSFDICNTPFFQTYEELNYVWFSSAFLFLETGYLGLTIYIGFYVLCFVCAFNLLRKKETNKLYCQISMIISVVCSFLTFYNSSLRMEVAYIVFFALALPFVSSNKNINYQRRFYIHR